MYIYIYVYTVNTFYSMRVKVGEEKLPTKLCCVSLVVWKPVILLKAEILHHLANISKLVNNWTNDISTGAGFRPSTV